MLLQVVVIPLTVPETESILSRLSRGLMMMGYTSLVLAVGVLGVAATTRRQLVDNWWVYAGSGFSAIQVILLDFDSYPDIYLGMIFVAMLVGIAYENFGARQRLVTVTVVSFVVFVSVVGAGGFGVVSSPVSVDVDESDAALQRTVQDLRAHYDGTGATPTVASDQLLRPPDMAEMYWSKTRPTACHYRLSVVERQWLRRTNVDPSAPKCTYLPPSWR